MFAFCVGMDELDLLEDWRRKRTGYSWHDFGRWAAIATLSTSMVMSVSWTIRELVAGSAKL